MGSFKYLGLLLLLSVLIISEIIYIIFAFLPSFELTVQAAILGALAAGVMGVLAAAISTISNVWINSRDTKERLKIVSQSMLYS